MNHISYFSPQYKEIYNLALRKITGQELSADEFEQLRDFLRWNGCALMFESTAVFISEMMDDVQDDVDQNDGDDNHNPNEIVSWGSDGFTRTRATRDRIAALGYPHPASIDEELVDAAEDFWSGKGFTSDKSLRLIFEVVASAKVKTPDDFIRLVDLYCDATLPILSIGWASQEMYWLKVDLLYVLGRYKEAIKAYYELGRHCVKGRISRPMMATGIVQVRRKSGLPFGALEFMFLSKASGFGSSQQEVSDRYDGAMSHMDEFVANLEQSIGRAAIIRSLDDACDKRTQMTRFYRTPYLRSLVESFSFDSRLVNAKDLDCYSYDPNVDGLHSLIGEVYKEFRNSKGKDFDLLNSELNL